MRRGQSTKARYNEGDEVMYHGRIYRITKVRREYSGFKYDFDQHERVDELFIDPIPGHTYGSFSEPKQQEAR